MSRGRRYDARRGKTAVDLETLREVGRALTRIPEGFAAHRKLQKIFEARAEAIAAGENLDWATAEALAFGTLLIEGQPVRLSGQDSERGTFSQRHAAIFDQNDGRRHLPLDHIRQHGSDRETLNVLYVVDGSGKLVDDVRIRELLLCSPEARVRDLRDGVFTALHATDDRETAVAAFRKYHRTVLPVVDGHGGLVGIVTVDDVLDVAEEEATEDIHKLGGVEQLDEPYLDISFFRLVRKRAVWLVVLFIGEMLTATAMGFFENEIERAAVLSTTTFSMLWGESPMK